MLAITGEFWENWESVSDLERAAVNTLKKGKELILNNVPRNKVFSIYVGGSFVRREMNEQSDVDLWLIVKYTSLLREAQRLHEKYKSEFKPPLSIQAYSLWELRMGKVSKKGKFPKTNPTKFLMRVGDLHRVYGKEIDPNDYKSRPIEEELRRGLRVFREKFIPEFEKTRKGFGVLAKQTFWLIDLEERFRGRNPPYSWRKLSESITDKNHIVHDSLQYREHPTKDERFRVDYLKKLKNYVAALEQEVETK